VFSRFLPPVYPDAPFLPDGYELERRTKQGPSHLFALFGREQIDASSAGKRRMQASSIPAGFAIRLTHADNRSRSSRATSKIAENASGMIW
jgi:hypothetical protein